MSADPGYTYGPQELCAWKVAPGTFWFQTTDPRYSRKLDQRQDTRRVAITGVNDLIVMFGGSKDGSDPTTITGTIYRMTGDVYVTWKGGAVTRTYSLKCRPT